MPRALSVSGNPHGYCVLLITLTIKLSRFVVNKKQRNLLSPSCFISQFISHLNAARVLDNVSCSFGCGDCLVFLGKLSLTAEVCCCLIETLVVDKEKQSCPCDYVMKKYVGMDVYNRVS
jgi:hypothetical protein